VSELEHAPGLALRFFGSISAGGSHCYKSQEKIQTVRGLAKKVETIPFRKTQKKLGLKIITIWRFVCVLFKTSNCHISMSKIHTGYTVANRK